jgi:hypothetical protein
LVAADDIVALEIAMRCSRLTPTTPVCVVFSVLQPTNTKPLNNSAIKLRH